MIPLKIICDSGVHCPTCRDLAGGREWRRQLAEKFKTTNAPDFDCPRNLPWGHREQELPRPSKGCGGCKKRKAMLNKLLPGLGTAVERALNPIARLLK